MTTLILDAGSGSPDNSGISNLFTDLPDKKIERLDINPDLKPDICADLTAPFPDEMKNKYDVVTCIHVIEHIERNKVKQVLQNLADALKEDGLLWLMAPSAEWAARQILVFGDDGPGVQGSLFGGQWTEWELHKNTMTLDTMRKTVGLVGLVPYKVFQNTFEFELYGQKYQPIGNCVIARKPKKEEK
jgi:2-polyprenyl-3-methyl-5-hydroxy-6-metoxy-1,4-benzoquinol methylase